MPEVKSARRVVDLLDLLSEEEKGLTVTQISQKMGIPQSSTSNLIQTLAALDVISYEEKTNTFSVGSRVARWRNTAEEGKIARICEQMEPYLTKARDLVGETTFLALYQQKDVVYIAKKESKQSIRTTARIGEKKPMYITGLGKAIMSVMSPERQNRILDESDMKKITPHTIVDKADMLERLQEYKRLGYAIDDEESEQGLLCFAVPLMNEQGAVIAGMSIAGLKERLLLKAEEAIGILTDISKNVKIKDA